MTETITVAEYREMLGKKNSGKGRARFSHIKRGWYHVAGLWYHFDSRAEYRFALILQFWTESESETGGWLHEPYEFDFTGEHHGITRYTPDFVRLGKDMLPAMVYEVKGKLNSGDQKKLKLMKKYFPGIDVAPITAGWWKTVGNQYRFLDGWDAEPIKKAELPEGAAFRPKTVPITPERFRKIMRPGKRLTTRK